MNREIKFRVFDKQLNKMCIATEIHFLQKALFIQTNGCASSGFVGDIFEVMQYTGLTDKNGKEIYESDIVKCKTRQTGKESNGVVVWLNGGLWGIQTDDYVSQESDQQRITNMYSNTDFEIIGNIYENPNLLTQY